MMIVYYVANRFCKLDFLGDAGAVIRFIGLQKLDLLLLFKFFFPFYLFF